MSTHNFEIHRAVVHWADPATGRAQVRVPALLGADNVVDIPNTGLTYAEGVWNVPPDGTSLFIAVSDDRTQFLWLSAVDADPVTPISDGSITTAKLADGSITTAKIADGTVTTSKIADGTVSVADLAAAVQNLLVPAGTIAATVKSTADTGWLMLNGSAIASADTLYPSLWAAAPASWKSGTTLNLPDMSNRTLGGSGSTSLGASGGSNAVTLSTSNLPAHNHSINHGHADNFSANQSQHRHTVDPPSATVSHTFSENFLYNLSDNYDPYMGVSNTGSTGSYKYDGSYTHSHTVNIPQFNSGYTDPAITISGGVTNHTGNSGNTGSGTSVDVTNAHLAVNFQIKAH